MQILISQHLSPTDSTYLSFDSDWIYEHNVLRLQTLYNVSTWSEDEIISSRFFFFLFFGELLSLAISEAAVVVVVVRGDEIAPS